MRAIRKGAVLLSVWMAGTAAGLGAPADEAFFPLQPGTEWVYATTHKAKNDTFDMRVEIDGSWSEGKGSGPVMKQKDKRGTMREFLLVNEKGVFIHKLGLSKALTPEVHTRFTPAVPRVIFPLIPGTTVHWEGRLKVAWVDKPIRFDGRVVGWEDVEVPAGKFRCIKLFYDQWRGDEHVQETAWYADGVGQVKYDGGQYVKELKEFKKP